MSNSPADRRIKFLARDLEFPTDPTFREYRMIQDLTGITANDIMTGQAGLWMLPALAIVAMMRADKNVSREMLDKILDLDPSEITVTGLDEPEAEDSPPDEAVKAAPKSTGTKSTEETLDKSGTQD